MKPGWQTTEFWTILLAKALSVLGIVGILNMEDSQMLTEAGGKIVGSVAIILANVFLIYNYIQARVRLKTLPTPQAPKEPPDAPAAQTTLAVLVLLVVGFLGCSLQAQTPQQPLPVPSTVHSPATFSRNSELGTWNRELCEALLPWRRKIEEQLKRQPGPQSPQGPQAPQIIYIQPPPAGGQGPLQTLPIQGEPKQLLPIQGEPKQLLPIQGEPKQQLPIPGEPRQQLPVPGNPQQQLPIQGNPQQQPPIDTPPLQQMPGPQRYTIFFHHALANPVP